MKNYLSKNAIFTVPIAVIESESYYLGNKVIVEKCIRLLKGYAPTLVIVSVTRSPRPRCIGVGVLWFCDLNAVLNVNVT